MSNVLIEQKGAITIIFINRPECLNAVDGTTAAQLADAFRAFDANPASHVAILTGIGGNFCAGADLKAVAGERGTPNQLSVDGDGPMGPTRMQLSKPVIAAISGYAVAGGLELACWCDLRVMDETAVTGVFCRKWGVPLIDGGTVRLPRLIGMSRAMDWILTGREINAQEALQAGFANRIAPTGAALEVAEELAGQLASLPQICMRNDRNSVLNQWNHPLSTALENELKLGLDTISSGETFKGAKQFSGNKNIS